MAGQLVCDLLTAASEYGTWKWTRVRRFADISVGLRKRPARSALGPPTRGGSRDGSTGPIATLVVGRRGGQDEVVVSLCRPAQILLGLMLGAIVAGCGGADHGHWTDPGARLVDGIWIGPQIACPPARDECGVISSGARAALSDAEWSKVVQVEWVELPTHFVTDGGGARIAGLGHGIETWVAALVTLDGGHERAVGLSCYFPYDPSGGLAVSAAHCTPAKLVDWQDGAVPPPPGIVSG